MEGGGTVHFHHLWGVDESMVPLLESGDPAIKVLLLYLNRDCSDENFAREYDALLRTAGWAGRTHFADKLQDEFHRVADILYPIFVEKPARVPPSESQREAVGLFLGEWARECVGSVDGFPISLTRRQGSRSLRHGKHSFQRNGHYHGGKKAVPIAKALIWVNHSGFIGGIEGPVGRETIRTRRCWSIPAGWRLRGGVVSRHDAIAAPNILQPFNANQLWWRRWRGGSWASAAPRRPRILRGARRGGR